MTSYKNDLLTKMTSSLDALESRGYEVWEFNGDNFGDHKSPEVTSGFTININYN